MRTTRKALSVFLALVMVLGLMPAVFATGTEYVYISVSHEGQFVGDRNGKPLAHTAVSINDLSAVDLGDYDLSDYAYDADGDGTYEITALHLYIYVHEALCGGDWNSDVTVTGSPGSIYFAGGLFGFEDENLRYNYNGAYPADENGWGFTADRIVLSKDDYFDVAHFEDWMFYADSAYGFHYFADSEGNIKHSFAAEAGEAVSVDLIRVGGGMGGGDTTTAEPGYTIYYGTAIGNTLGTVTTDGDGTAKITFEGAGTYHIWCDGGLGIDAACDAFVSSPAWATVTVTGNTAEEPTEAPIDPSEGQAQDVSAIINATMEQLATTVAKPAFGTNAGEWTVLCLARGGYYVKENTYFADYYERIVEIVNETAAAVDLNGALSKNKSTDNSRLIVALSAIGKNATVVGDWDLVEAYSANGLDWIKKQGINGAIWALIALDSNDYATTDTAIRQQCVDYILNLQHNDGGWALATDAATDSDPDITGMALQALYNYKDQSAVAAAAEEAFAWLSDVQLANGGFATSGAETTESAAQVIVACATWGINPDTDSRFVKNGFSAIDAVLAHYVAEEAMFQHQVGAGTNDMATDQSCYALIAYDRLLKGKPALYDYRDVTFDEVIPSTDEMTAVLGLPAQINAGDAFNGTISINKWDNEAGFKLIDFIVNIPEGVAVTGVTANERLTGGEVSYNLEIDTGKLRVVYFDATKNSDITITGEEFPAGLFTIGFKAENVTGGSKLSTALSGMSVKLTSDSSDEEAMIVVNTDAAKGTVDVVVGISFSAVCLYEGDDVDLIPADKKAVAVAITGITRGAKLTFRDGDTEVVFKYSKEVTEKTGISTYVAIVDAAIDTAKFVDQSKFVIGAVVKDAVTFGDSNGDSVINAQDALAVVDAWLRKGGALTNDDILTLNVNGDSRINTFDALGIVEAFVNGTEYGVVTKAATVTTKR